MDLSVIISACNMQRHVAACLRSVTRCPRDTIHMECIVVSEDDRNETAAIVNRYIERDSRIRLVTVRSGAAVEVRNEGIEAAQGTYILFLDADSRLCEDAWEQIEAAVEEEYADFVAFSSITARRSGKLVAQMLPIADVVSNDPDEARRLMHTGSALRTCEGKLFKGRIIRDNNILFRTELSTGGDFMFVAEYFEHSESYLLTKAMILYCPRRDANIWKNYSMEESIARIGAVYDFHTDVVGRYHDSALTACVRVYYLDMLMTLLGTYERAYSYSRAALETLYENALRDKFVKRLLCEVDERMIRSGMLKYEYRLLRQGSPAKLRKYFAIRALLPVADRI
ncbi:MAG: glycosyltransferase [Lachnospiraceae bacterium]|nr:glycosyltransferase [Lachnospiraceae bacterium]MDE7029459.1 glycosyltransferase [Lachnospiraceae bacterium]